MKESPPVGNGGGWPSCDTKKSRGTIGKILEEDSCDSDSIETQEKRMRRCRVLSFLLISAALLSFSLSQAGATGFGRRIGILRAVDKGTYSFEPEERSEREMMEMEMEMDYKEPGANTNPRSGGFYNPPPSPRP